MLDGGMLREETGILAGKTQGRGEVEDIQGMGQGLHGWIPGGTREEDIPWTSSPPTSSPPKPARGSDLQVGRGGMSR